MRPASIGELVVRAFTGRTNRHGGLKVGLSLPCRIAALVFTISMWATPAVSAQSAPDLLEVLRANGSITQEQYEALSGQASSSAPPARPEAEAGPSATDIEEASLPPVSAAAEETPEDGSAIDESDQRLNERIADAVAKKIEEELPVKASYGSKGFRLETRDGNWQMNLQWRLQFRLTNPSRGDPRQVDDFEANAKTTFETRRARMKIGGHGYKPWLKYYFEVDLQPSRDADDSSTSASARLIDWRIDVAKYKQIGLRVGQWKIDYNRERVDSSGRQEFVERSIVNRIFTIDRQMGISVRGRLFEGTPGDLVYAFGAFSGQGRGVENDDNNLMYTGRLQWNFLGRDVPLRQTDVERTPKPAASLAFAAATTQGECTRWSSSGCGNLDGFARTINADAGQFRVHQAVQEFAFKWQGWSIQQEAHWKQVIDRSYDQSDPRNDSNFWGLYAQTGYFFNELFPVVPKQLELAFRYAIVREPNETDILKKNTRQEFTAAANWFIAGHNNKLTLDYSHLTLDDDVLNRNVSDDRVRLQWDISF
jgi:phosphate-selective porin OprO/OprP